MKNFLTAEWRKLAIANYAVDPKLLTPYLPTRTELDCWQDTCYVSLVGFRFCNTRLKGIRIPFHSNFEEVNLRFYVRFKEGNQWRRGVVFIKEIVPRHAITWIANLIYGENYATYEMKHTWATDHDSLSVRYHWKADQWHSFEITADKKVREMIAGSEEEFITEHYWGYTRHDHESTSEYEVERTKWQAYDIRNYALQVDFGKLYGEKFSHLTKEQPKSVFLAEGSQIKVKHGRRLPLIYTDHNVLKEL
jgi:uncharacterized protein YqjF (DUF2071 family)